VNETLGNEAAAFATLNTLLTDYAHDPDLVECIRPLADSYEGKKDFNTAIRIHQYVSDTQPENGMAVWSQFKVFQIALTKLNDDVLADRAYQQIWERYSGHNRIAQVVCEAAWEYRKLRRQGEALEMYRAAQAAQPDNDRAIIAQRGIVHCLLALQDYPAAVAEAQKLFAAFPQDKQLLLTAIEVGDALGWAKLYPEALAMYQYVVNNRPNDSQAIAAQRRVVTAHVNMQDEAAAQQALNTLTTRFAGNPQLSKEVYTIGECYRARKDYPAARALYDRVTAEFPQTNDALWSRQRCMVMDIDVLDDPNHPATEVPAEILQAADDMILNYAAEPRMVKALLFAGEEYYNRAFRKDISGLSPESAVEFAKASTIFQKIITQAPVDPKSTGDAHYMTAVALSRAHRYEEAIAHHQALLELWPEHDLAWSSQYWVGTFYQELRKSKAMSVEEADAKSEEAFLALFAKYPANPMTDSARSQLGMIYFKSNQWEKAAGVYEQILKESPPGEKVPKSIYYLAQVYERIGQKEMAVLAYEAFVADWGDTALGAMAAAAMAKLGGQQ
jgi:tetratricopeptide (TPR) repeat protein